MDWWQHIPERVNPNIVEIGSFHIRYYGLMYLIAFATTYLLVLYRLRTEQRFGYTKPQVQNYFFWAIAGVLVGGRLGYVLFYDLGYFIAHPLRIVSPFDYTEEGFRYVGLLGMSYHGGLIGVVLGTLIFCHREKINIWRWADLLSPAVPLGYTFGRIGNFLNSELYGRVTTVPWGMYFPTDMTVQLRHPSQLYEALFEGVLLFIVLWKVRKKHPFDGFHFCLYLIGYGTVRFMLEFFREPNEGLASVWGYFTMGQVLCLGMICAGVLALGARKIIDLLNIE